ncbi:MAG: 4Fe-4S binding protein [Coriobacteriia bacterium]|nr:4Fe-4S binding protein [Coriobacteriia bacterium]
MTEKAILFDSSRCTACRGCQVACKCWNDLPSEPTAERPYDSVNWDGKFTHPADLNSCTRLITTFNDFESESSQKRVGWAFGRRACQHCTEAGCVNICPAGALHKDPETGFITYDQSKCIGCQNCSSACPFDVPRYEDQGGKTVINKCSGCVDRVAHGMKPACVTTCQSGALQFGDRDEMIALANERVEFLHDHGYEDACIYGVDEMAGLHVIQVLKHGMDAHGAVANPSIPVTATLSGILKPVTAVGAGATVLGLAAMFGLAAGYKRDTLVYNDATGDTISLETGEVTKQGNGPDERSVKEALTENLPFVGSKKGGDGDE